MFFNLGVEVWGSFAAVMALGWWLPRLAEIVGHRLTPERAADIGLIRIYGDQGQTARLRAIIAGPLTVHAAHA